MLLQTTVLPIPVKSLIIDVIIRARSSKLVLHSVEIGLLARKRLSDGGRLAQIVLCMVWGVRVRLRCVVWDGGRFSLR
jgi:hypothetical protein